jgi:serine/threonine protein kinase
MFFSLILIYLVIFLFSLLDVYVHKIASGGQGTVACVKRKNLRSKLARKIFFTNTPIEYREREIDFSLGHNCPYLVKGVDWFVHQAQTYLVMKRCKNRSLSYYLTKSLKNTRLAPLEVFFFLRFFPSLFSFISFFFLFFF